MLGEHLGREGNNGVFIGLWVVFASKEKSNMFVLLYPVHKELHSNFSRQVSIQQLPKSKV